ncbi:MAG TPA: hypothetical protein VF514_00810 [Bacteroidota bacterium]
MRSSVSRLRTSAAFAICPVPSAVWPVTVLIASTFFEICSLAVAAKP